MNPFGAQDLTQVISQAEGEFNKAVWVGIAILVLLGVVVWKS